MLRRGSREINNPQIPPNTIPMYIKASTKHRASVIKPPGNWLFIYDMMYWLGDQKQLSLIIELPI